MSTFLMRLVSMTITASIIILVVIAMRFLLKKAPKVFSYVLWLIVLVRLLCPVSISTSLSIFNLLNISTNDFGEIIYFKDDTAISDIENPETQTASDNQTSAMTGDADNTYWADEEAYEYAHLQDSSTSQYTRADSDAGMTEINIPDRNGSPDSEDKDNGVAEYSDAASTAGSLGNISAIDSDDALYDSRAIEDNNKSVSMAGNILFIVWISGALILFSVNMISLLRIRKKTAASVRLKDNVYLCDDITTPFCLGIIRPNIYLPSSLEKHERKYIYLHEKHHIKRLDHVVKCVAFLALCIHWFNPLVWLAFILAEKDMEMSCDEAVMRQMNDDVRKEYSYSLLRLAAGKKIFIPSNLAFGDGNTKARIKNVMNYKKPVFWVVVVAVIACVCLALVLGTNPKRDAVSDTEVADNTVSVNDGGADITTDDNDIYGNESGEGGSDDTELKMYYELIHRIEDAMYSGAFENNPEDFLEPDGNSICSSEFYHLYDGSGDIAYQNLGYRIMDIDKDGTRELLLGENSISEDEEYPYDGIIYDLYTIRDGEVIHLFGGWPRNRYYLTETDVIACEWDSSAFYYGTTFYQYNAGNLDYIEELIFDYQEENKGSITYKSETEERELYNIGEAADILSKYQYVYPEFIPIGPKWNKLEDIDGDGSNDYVIYTGREGYYNHIAIYLAHEGIVFEHDDELPVDVGDISQIDIDHDGENEILITMWPHVNSMPLEEYAVIKKTSSGWQELEGCADNAFPIHVYKDKEHYSLSISCDGFDKAILYDVEYLYDFYVEQVELNGAETYYSEVKNFYMSDVYSASVGSEVGEVCAYGIWNIIVSSYNGQTCLVAEHGIQGRDKCDPWGLVQVYFDYDSDGKIRILDLVHVPYMPTDDELLSNTLIKDEVLEMKDKVLYGMSDDEVNRLCKLIKDSNHDMELKIIYQNFFAHLESPDDLTWNYIDKSGEIQIGWAFDGSLNKYEIMRDENLTEQEFYDKYGTEVVTNNEYSAVDLAQSLTEIRESVNDELLRQDLQNLIDELLLAAETHDVIHVENAYHILHDMDYWLLNYRYDTESVYIEDESTILKYYGVLSVYADQ